MRLRGSIEPFIASVALLLFACGCSTSGCIDNSNSLPLAGFYDISGAPVALGNVMISGVGAPNDSLLNDTTRSISQTYLPFRSTVNETSFAIVYGLHDDAPSDTLTFRYNSLPRFVSEECGALFFYRLTGVEHTSVFIDSVAVTDSLITNVDKERLKIIFKGLAE